MLESLTRRDTSDSAFRATQRNIEVACGYAIRYARKFCQRKGAWLDVAEMEERCILSVLRAANNYDPKNLTEASFFTYSYSMAAGAALENFRQQLRWKSKLTTSAYIDIASQYEQVSENHRDLSSCDSAMRFGVQSFFFCSYIKLCEEFEDTMIDVIDFPYQIERARSILTDQEFRVMIILMNGQNQTQTAAFLGVTVGRISQIRTSILKKLVTD